MKVEGRVLGARVALAILLLTPITLAADPAVERGPYLQTGTSTGVVVNWRTDVATIGRVSYGTRVNNLNHNADGLTSTTDHSVQLSGLRPGRKYYYSVGSVGAAKVPGDAERYYVAAPATGQARPTRIWALGDSGTADANARAVRDAYVAFSGGAPTDVWLMLGDNAYDNGTDAEYGAAVFDMYPDQLRNTALWTAIGNHDRFDAGTYPYTDIFTLPTQGEAGGVASQTEWYYSFDHGNIHFIALDSFISDRSPPPTGAMLTWLEEDLMLTDADWVIVYWHHPPYSKGSHDSDTETRLVEMRTNAVPILDSYGVDLVLAGHSHSYERSVLLDSHYGTSDTLLPAMVLDDGADGTFDKASTGSVPHEGAVYVVAGSSGKTSGGLLNHPAMVVSLSELGSVVVDIDGNTLTANFLQSNPIDNSWSVADSFTLVKGPVCVDLGEACSSDADCCSNKCRGPQNGKTCR